jgi:hypothetical protein
MLLMDDLALAAWQNDLVHSTTTNKNCTLKGFRKRFNKWQKTVRQIFSGTAVETVQEALVPCGGFDALSTMAVFPNANITLVSIEPPLPKLGLGKAMVRSVTGGDVIGCERVLGGYNLGYLLRQFAIDQGGGVLPVLLASLGAAGVNVSGLRLSPGYGSKLTAIEMRCTPAETTNRTPFTLRYVQADLLDSLQLDELKKMEKNGKMEKHVIGVLIKGAENCFRNKIMPSSAEGLSEHILQVSGVLVQDTESGIRFPLIENWIRKAGGIMPFGSLITRTKVDKVHQGQLKLRDLFLKSKNWRSLRGQRFGYCNGHVDLMNAGAESIAALFARTHQSEPFAQGDTDWERGQHFYCSAVLAWKGEDNELELVLDQNTIPRQMVAAFMLCILIVFWLKVIPRVSSKGRQD